MSTRVESIILDTIRNILFLEAEDSKHVNVNSIRGKKGFF